MSDVWYSDVKQLWASPGEFFPRTSQSDAERLNASVRLIAYCSIAATLVGQKPRYIVIGLALIALLSASFYVSNKQDYEASSVQKKMPEKCTKPTPDNPFMNFLPFDDPKKPPACPYETVSEEIYKKFNEGIVRDAYDVVYGWENTGRFVTMPVTTKIQDTAEFANAVYGPRADLKEKRQARIRARGTMDFANTYSA